MKLLKILNGNDGGGIYECEMQFIGYWKKNNIEVHAIIVGEGKASRSYKNIVDKYFVLPTIPLVSKRYTPIKEIINIISVKKYIGKYLSLIDKFEFDHYSAIILRRHYYIGIASHMSKKIKTKVYWHMPLSIRSYIEKQYFRYIIRKHQIKVIGNSKYTLSSMGYDNSEHVYPGFNDKKVPTINTKPYYRKKLSIPDRHVVFGIAARITKRKAIHIVIKSFSKLCNKYEGIHLIIAGEPLNTKYAKKCISLANKANANVHFLGNVDIMPEFYESIDVFIHSIIDVEAFGISVAESLGSGLPVIAHSSGGPKEMVIHNYNGWLVKKANVNQYYNAMQEAILSKEELKNMGVRSKNMSKIFRADKNANKFIEIINNG